MKVFVTAQGQTKKLVFDEPPSVARLQESIAARFAGLQIDDDTVLYIDDADRRDVFYELETAGDIVNGSSIRVQSKKQLTEAASTPTAAPAVARVAVVAQKPTKAAQQQQQQQQQKAAIAAAAANAANTEPVFLPNGTVRIGNVVYQVPRGGTGGEAKNVKHWSDNWLVRAVIGHPFRCKSPRTGLQGQASLVQVLAKLIYGNPAKPSYMTVKQEKKFIERQFKRFDLDRDGELSLIEFALLADRLGRDMYPLQVQAAFHRIDKNRNGTLDFEEFCAWWLTEVRPPPQAPSMSMFSLKSPFKKKMTAERERALVLRAFAMFDADGNGSIDPAEFKALSRQTGASLTDAEVHQVFAAIDTDGNGVLTFDEFYAWFVGSSANRGEALEHLRKNVAKFSRSRWLDKLAEGTPLSAERREAKRRARVRRLFEHFDADRSGALDVAELRELAAQLGDDMSLVEAQHVLASIDTDNNGTVEFDEFYAWFEADAARSERADGLARRLRGFQLFSSLDDSDERRRALRAFNRFDLDNNGVIDKSEFKQLTHAMGVEMTDAQIMQQLYSIDLDGNGVVDFDEFYAWWSEERRNAPKTSRDLKTSMRVRRAWRSFLGAPQREVDWDKLTPDNAEPRASNDNDDADDDVADKQASKKSSKKATELREVKKDKKSKNDDNDDEESESEYEYSYEADDEDEGSSEYEYEYEEESGTESIDGSLASRAKKAEKAAKQVAEEEDGDSYEYEYESEDDDDKDEDEDEDDEYESEYEYETEEEYESEEEESSEPPVEAKKSKKDKKNKKK